MSGLWATMLAVKIEGGHIVVGGVAVTGTTVALVVRAAAAAKKPMQSALKEYFTPVRASALTPGPNASPSLAARLSEAVVAASPRPTDGSSVFVSYPRSEKPYVLRLVGALRNQGLDVWFDDKISPGAGWLGEIKRQLERSSVVVVVMSDKQEPSNIFEEEIIYARHLVRPVFPLSIGEASYFGLKGLQAVKVTRGSLPSPAFLSAVANAARA